MRLRISHTTSYRYDEPPSSVIQTLRLTPRNHDGQYVVAWRIDLSENCQLSQHEDAFGNITHVFSVDGPLKELRLNVEGQVETQDTNGVVRGAVERFPPSLYLRETALTRIDAELADFARAVRGEAGGETLAVLHGLLGRLNADMTHEPSPAAAAITGAEAFALKRGVCQDLAHVFIAAARSLGIPARYISGHFHRPDGAAGQEAAWAEAFVPDLGWVAFDPANGISATDAHVRVAVGLDYLDAAPVRGSRLGGAGEGMQVAVTVSQGARQAQG